MAHYITIVRISVFKRISIIKAKTGEVNDLIFKFLTHDLALLIVCR
ncbi:PilI type IV pilus biogenesis protein [Salmonella enterica]|nr:PilI type IV pilus biogenesis protein [Salmonella enterica]EKB5613727.1 PilI type IV pilus biogenesis protein [Salmonella enterica]EKC9530564.1 PilI type IV pilus biogenesis protein [Salmonella enterica]ELQ3908000.1 PilI type IV pilus biogenesis protein [Salmonella enterica]ELR6482043.1 PilI type IV pilus biogenesis protein [Salmonella enterica]